METLNKVRSQTKFTPQDWEQYLQETHKDEPSMTPSIFSYFRTRAGENSYEFLVSKANVSTRVEKLNITDFACGDGHLYRYLEQEISAPFTYTGIDMSDGELDVARANLGTKDGVRFLSENVKATSLEDNSQDFIFAHMAFMLMNPIDEVVREIQRVLKPGGEFWGVVSSRRDMVEGFFKAAYGKMVAIIDAEIPNIRQMPMGSELTRNEEGIRSLFATEGFAPDMDVEPFHFQIEEEPKNLWRLFRHMYFVDLLSTEGREQLQREIVAVAEQYKNDDGKVECEFPLLAFGVRKV